MVYKKSSIEKLKVKRNFLSDISSSSKPVIKENLYEGILYITIASHFLSSPLSYKPAYLTVRLQSLSITVGMENT